MINQLLWKGWRITQGSFRLAQPTNIIFSFAPPSPQKRPGKEIGIRDDLAQPTNLNFFFCLFCLLFLQTISVKQIEGDKPTSVKRMKHHSRMLLARPTIKTTPFLIFLGPWSSQSPPLLMSSWFLILCWLFSKTHLCAIFTCKIQDTSTILASLKICF